VVDCKLIVEFRQTQNGDLQSKYSYGRGSVEDQEDSDSEFEAINEKQNDAEKKENLRMVKGNESGLLSS
jgi:hypothetical protein